MKQIFEKFKWTDKPEMKREHILLISIGIVLLIGFFKFKPYFEKPTKVIVTSEKTEPVKTPNAFLEKTGLASDRDSPIPVNNLTSSSGSNRANYAAPQPSFSSNSVVGSANPASKIGVIERPLFDGLEVVLKGTLINSISSLASENPADVKITGFIPNEITQGIDNSQVVGAQLKGVVTPNHDKKVLNISFAQIITPYGRSYPVTGYAIDLANKTLGIAAEYSSGLSKRLLGTIIDRVIVAGDQIGMGALISGSATDPVQATIQMAAMEANQQAASDLSREATRDLRNTQPELSAPAGTTIALKVRVLPGGTNGN